MTTPLSELSAALRNDAKGHDARAIFSDNKHALSPLLREAADALEAAAVMEKRLAEAERALRDIAGYYGPNLDEINTKTLAVLVRTIERNTPTRTVDYEAKIRELTTKLSALADDLALDAEVSKDEARRGAYEDAGRRVRRVIEG